MVVVVVVVVRVVDVQFHFACKDLLLDKLKNSKKNCMGNFFEFQWKYQEFGKIDNYIVGKLVIYSDFYWSN